MVVGAFFVSIQNKCTKFENFKNTNKMKKILTLFMCLVLVGLYSCSSDDDNDGGGDTGVTLKVKATYELENEIGVLKPDAGAKAYVFYDFDFNTAGFTFQNGKYVKDSQSIAPDQTMITDSNGNASIVAKYTNRSVTVVVVSSKYNDKFLERYIEKLTTDEIVAVNFKP